jgi:hypothetical protein
MELFGIGQGPVEVEDNCANRHQVREPPGISNQRIAGAISGAADDEE